MRLSLKTAIETTGLLKVGINLNDYFSFEKANEYGATYVENFAKRNLKDTARQEKSSKDSVLGKLVEEVIICVLKFDINHSKKGDLISLIPYNPETFWYNLLKIRQDIKDNG